MVVVVIYRFCAINTLAIKSILITNAVSYTARSKRSQYFFKVLWGPGANIRNDFSNFTTKNESSNLGKFPKSKGQITGGLTFSIP